MREFQSRALERQEKRREAGVSQVYPQHAGRSSPANKPAPASCPNRGEATGEMEQCQTCTGNVQLKVFACKAHPEGCTFGKKVEGRHLCTG